MDSNKVYKGITQQSKMDKLSGNLTEYERFDLICKYQEALSAVEDMKIADKASLAESEMELESMYKQIQSAKKKVVHAQKFSIVSLFLWVGIIIFIILGSILLSLDNTWFVGFMFLVLCVPLLWLIAWVFTGVISAYNPSPLQNRSGYVVGSVFGFLFSAGIYGIILSFLMVKMNGASVDNIYRNAMGSLNIEIESKKQKIEVREQEISQYRKMIEKLV